MADHEAYGRAVEVGLILGIAEALRAELGVTIDAHPGGVGSEAGVVNRAFRSMARCILIPTVTTDEDAAEVLNWALRLAARRRLKEMGVVAPLAESLLDQGPGLGDDWLAYLAMASKEVVGELIARPPEGESREGVEDLDFNSI